MIFLDIKIVIKNSNHKFIIFQIDMSIQIHQHCNDKNQWTYDESSLLTFLFILLLQHHSSNAAQCMLFLSRRARRAGHIVVQGRKASIFPSCRPPRHRPAPARLERPTRTPVKLPGPLLTSSVSARPHWAGAQGWSGSSIDARTLPANLVSTNEMISKDLQTRWHWNTYSDQKNDFPLSIFDLHLYLPHEKTDLL